MNVPEHAAAGINIATAERETGLGKDTLRVWEKRYGFPTPTRDSKGERLYSREQIVRLRGMKRLIDRGYRPGRVATASDIELRSLEQNTAPAESELPARGTLPDPELLALLRCHDSLALRTFLAQQLAGQGITKFVCETLPSFSAQVGEAWARGELEIFEEHLYTEQVKTLLRLAINGFPPGRTDLRVLLTTVPGERHTLGILMVESLLTLHGVATISLGEQTPLQDIVAAALAHRADVVAISFSGAFPLRHIQTVVGELRKTLPPQCRIWVGGAGSDSTSFDLNGVDAISSLDQISQLIDDCSVV